MNIKKILIKNIFIGMFLPIEKFANRHNIPGRVVSTSSERIKCFFQSNLLEFEIQGQLNEDAISQFHSHGATGVPNYNAQFRLEEKNADNLEAQNFSNAHNFFPKPKSAKFWTF